VWDFSPPPSTCRVPKETFIVSLVNDRVQAQKRNGHSELEAATLAFAARAEGELSVSVLVGKEI